MLRVKCAWQRCQVTPLKMAVGGFDQATMIVRDEEIRPMQAALFEPAKELAPTPLRFAVAQLASQNFMVAVGVDAAGNQCATCAHLPLFAHMDDQHVDDHKGNGLPL